MKLINISVLLPAIIFLFSCNENKGYELYPTGKIITVKLSEKTKCYSHCIVPFKDKSGKQFLYLENTGENRLEIYDCVNGDFLKSINYSKEGPNGIPGMSGFFLSGPDSVFVFNNGSDPGVFYLTDTGGEIVKKIRLKNDSEHSFIPECPSSNISISVAREGDNLILPASFALSGVVKQEDMATLKLLSKISLSTGEYELLPVTFPVFYNKAGKPVYEFYSFVENDGKYVFSFIYSDCIYYTDDFKTLKKIQISSRYEGNKDFITRSNEDNWNIKKNISLPRYRSFYFDPKNKVYYRFFQPGEEWDNGRDFMTQGLYPKRFSVIIADRNFKVLGETMLPVDKYVASMSFMTDEGLYISSTNINDPSCNEDYLKFELFSIRKSR